MVLMDVSLANLVNLGKISLETAYAYSLRPKELDRLVKGETEGKK